MDAAELAKKTVKDLKKELTDRSGALLATLMLSSLVLHLTLTLYRSARCRSATRSLSAPSSCQSNLMLT